MQSVQADLVLHESRGLRPCDLPGGLSAHVDVFICNGRIRTQSERAHPSTRLIFFALHNSVHDVLALGPSLARRQDPVVFVLGMTDATLPRQVDVRWPKLSVADQRNLSAVFSHASVKRVFAHNLDARSLGPKVQPLPIGLVLNLKQCIGAKGAVASCKPPTFQPTLADYHKQCSRDALPLSSRPLQLRFASRVRFGDGPFVARKHMRARLLRPPWSAFGVVARSARGSEVSHVEHLKGLREQAFVACVHGGGLDPCPCAFEAILCGTIPLVEAFDPLADGYDGLPLVMVSNFSGPASSLSVAKLASWRSELAKYYETPALRARVLCRLTMRYWLRRMRQVEDEEATCGGPETLPEKLALRAE